MFRASLPQNLIKCVLILGLLTICTHHLFFIWFKRALLLAKVLFELIFSAKSKVKMHSQSEVGKSGRAKQENTTLHWVQWPLSGYQYWKKCNLIFEMSSTISNQEYGTQIHFIFFLSKACPIPLLLILFAFRRFWPLEKIVTRKLGNM